MPALPELPDLLDCVDILIVSVFLYPIVYWSRTRSSRGFGIAAVTAGLVYAIAVQFDLYLTTQVFQLSFMLGAVVAIVVFQDELRRTLSLSRLQRFLRGPRRDPATLTQIDTIVGAAFDLAARGRGALLVLPGLEPIGPHLDGGVVLKGQLSSFLLDSLFDPHSAGHDGAAIIQNGLVTRFAAHLPLSADLEKSAQLGTRHRSALGLSEQTDALVIVVSEERQHVSIALHGELHRNVSREDLAAAVQAHLGGTAQADRYSFSAGVVAVMTRHPGMKLLSILLAMAGWFLLVSDRDIVQRVFLVPIEYRNVPRSITLSDTVPTEARVTFSASERAFQFVAPSTLKISVDLQEAASGKEAFTLTESSVRHPASLTVYGIEPRTIRIAPERQ